MRTDAGITAGSCGDEELPPAAEKAGQRGLGVLSPQHRWSERWAGDHTGWFLMLDCEQISGKGLTDIKNLQLELILPVPQRWLDLSML